MSFVYLVSLFNPLLRPRLETYHVLNYVTQTMRLRFSHNLANCSFQAEVHKHPKDMMIINLEVCSFENISVLQTMQFSKVLKQSKFICQSKSLYNPRNMITISFWDNLVKIGWVKFCVIFDTFRNLSWSWHLSNEGIFWLISPVSFFQMWAI